MIIAVAACSDDVASDRLPCSHPLDTRKRQRHHPTVRRRWLALLPTVAVAVAGGIAACDTDTSARPADDAGVEAAPPTSGVPATRSEPAALTSVPIPENPSKPISAVRETTTTSACGAGGGPSCGSGQCCPSGYSCALADGCATPCPAEHPLRCDINKLGGGGKCCLPNGCPAGDHADCACPPDLPNLVNGRCSAPCPAAFPFACTSVCCAAGCNPGTGNRGCGCGAAPACGAGCCATGQECVDGACMACPADHPVHCGASCCASNEQCVNGACAPAVKAIPCPPTHPVSCASYCCATGFACGANGDCVGARFP